MAVSAEPDVLRASGVTKHFAGGGTLRSSAPLRAVDGVDLDLRAGEVLALVGESGSGKSTLARCLLGLERPTSGHIVFEGQDVATARGAAGRRLRRGMQPVFQDPYASLDPRWTVGRSVREALDRNGIGTKEERTRRVTQLLTQVGLSDKFADRRPHELSGGQRQRVCIAAALAPEPRLLVADEPVTALDVSVQAQILNLLHEIQSRLDLTVLLIAHDLSVVAHIADRIAVMYLGKVVEVGSKETVLSDPRHPYTQALLSATPRPDPGRPTRAEALRGETPSARNPPDGCSFHPRCRWAIERCSADEPGLEPCGAGRNVACHVKPVLEARDEHHAGSA